MNDKELQIVIEKRVAEILSDPVRALEIYKRRNEMLEYQVMEMKPKADFYDAVADCEDLTEMSAVAKVLNFKNLGRNKIFAILRDKGVLRYNNEPYQEYASNRGYFKVIEQEFTNPVNGEKLVGYKTMVTQAGIDFIRKMLLEDGYEYSER